MHKVSLLNSTFVALYLKNYLPKLNLILFAFISQTTFLHLRSFYASICNLPVGRRQMDGERWIMREYAKDRRISATSQNSGYFKKYAW